MLFIGIANAIASNAATLSFGLLLNGMSGCSRCPKVPSDGLGEVSSGWRAATCFKGETGIAVVDTTFARNALTKEQDTVNDERPVDGIEQRSCIAYLNILHSWEAAAINALFPSRYREKTTTT